MNIKFIKGDWVRLPMANCRWQMADGGRRMAVGQIRGRSARGDAGGDIAARYPCPGSSWGCTKVTIIYDNYDNSTNITSFFKHLFDGMDGFDGAKTRIVRCRVYESYDNNESYMRKILTGWTG